MDVCAHTVTLIQMSPPPPPPHTHTHTQSKTYIYAHYHKNTVIISIFYYTQEPIYCQGEVNAGCWCCNCGGYSAVFCANCRGCVPGEILLLYTEVENNTRWSNCSAEIRLKLVSNERILCLPSSSSSSLSSSLSSSSLLLLS